MDTVGWVLAGLAGLLHVYIFVLEALRFDDPGTRRVFRIEEEHAEAVRPWAWNQGWYNLFLAVVTGIGIIAVIVGETAVGAALIFAGVGSMLAAAVVLLASSPDKARSALIQGFFPLVAILLLFIGLVR